MSRTKKEVVLFGEVGKGDVGLVGGKGANLGEMTNAGIPVPPGFIVTAAAYFDFIEEAGLHDKMKTLLDPLDVHDSRQLQAVAAKVQKLIQDAEMPESLAAEIKKPIQRWVRDWWQ